MIETKFAVRRKITIIWVKCVKKNSQIRTLIKKLLAKYRFFKKLPQISQNHKNHNFSRIIVILMINCFYPINVMAVAWQEYFFFNFASCEPLKDLQAISWKQRKYTYYHDVEIKIMGFLFIAWIVTMVTLSYVHS